MISRVLYQIGYVLVLAVVMFVLALPTESAAPIPQIHAAAAAAPARHAADFAGDGFPTGQPIHQRRQWAVRPGDGQHRPNAGDTWYVRATSG